MDSPLSRLAAEICHLNVSKASLGWRGERERERELACLRSAGKTRKKMKSQTRRLEDDSKVQRAKVRPPQTERRQKEASEFPPVAANCGRKFHLFCLGFARFAGSDSTLSLGEGSFAISDQPPSSRTLAVRSSHCQSGLFGSEWKEKVNESGN